MGEEKAIVTAVGLGVLGTAIYLAYNFVSQGRKQQIIDTLKGALDTTTDMVESSAEMMTGLKEQTAAALKQSMDIAAYSKTLEDKIAGLNVEITTIKENLTDKVVVTNKTIDYLKDNIVLDIPLITETDLINKIRASYENLKGTGYTGTGAFAV